MSWDDDRWRNSYDAWKLATPPEYDAGPEPDEDWCRIAIYDKRTGIIGVIIEDVHPSTIGEPDEYLQILGVTVIGDDVEIGDNIKDI